jgi:diguanylate cyclase (GGDEF)-like protein
MLDIDNFKNYNDSYGHLKGDELLVLISKIFKKVVKRSGDFAFRMGGEEFGILLPNTEASGAAFIAERIRSEVERIGEATISIGMASFIPQVGDTSDCLLKLADSNLYRAKNIGRNMVVC